METVKDRKATFLEVFVETGGGIIKACEAAGIDRDTFFTWVLDPGFESLYTTAREVVLVSFEEKHKRTVELFNATINIYEQQQEALQALINEQAEVIRQATDSIKQLKTRIVELEGTR